MQGLGDQFLLTITSFTDEGRTLLVTALDRSPRDHFEASSVAQLYAAVDRWETWRVRLVSRLQRELAEPEQLVRYAGERFAASRFLNFYLRSWQVPENVVPVDLSNRDHFLDPSGLVAMRQLMVYGREEPTWKTVRENIARDLQGLEQLVRQLHGSGDLVFVGEPRSPTLADALSRLGAVSYLDHTAIKACATVAETHFRAGHLKSCAAMLRPAVEQVIKDAYIEATRRQFVPAPATTPDLRAQTDALGRGATPFVEKSVAHFAYGTFSLLSGLGSHTGQVDDASGQQAWHAAVAALLLLGARLPQ